MAQCEGCENQIGFHDIKYHCPACDAVICGDCMEIAKENGCPVCGRKASLGRPGGPDNIKDRGNAWGI